MVGSMNIVHIGKSLKSFQNLHIPEDINSINVHQNQLSNFTGLEHCKRLQQLDISSNQLVELTGLSKLASLRSANFACNNIQVVCNEISELKNLVHINLSYNSISSLFGFLTLHGTISCLKSIELHGNCLNNIQHVTQCLNGVISLQHLVLEWQGQSNPLCRQANYRRDIFSQLPQLVSLNRVDRHGKSVHPTQTEAVDELLCDWSIQSSDIGDEDAIQNCKVDNQFYVSDLIWDPDPVTAINIKTPNIDAVMSQRKSSRDKSSGEQRSQSLIAGEDSDVVPSNSQSDIIPDEIPSLNTKPASPKKSVLKVDKQSSSKLPKRTTKDKKHVGLKKVSNSSQPSNIKVSSSEDERAYLELLQELEAERERRWKAENASRKLISQTQAAHREKSKDVAIQNLATATVERLKRTLIHERELHEQFKEEFKSQSKKLKMLTAEHSTVTKSLSDLECQNKNLNHILSAKKAEVDSLTEINQKKLSDEQMKYCHARKCFDDLRLQKQRSDEKLIEAQQQLLNREAEYKKSLDGLFSTDSSEFHNAVQLEVKKHEKAHKQELERQNNEITQHERKYKELEDEFREALHIEADRFEEVKIKYHDISDRADLLDRSLKKALDKEEKSRSIIIEMTSIIKEQKSQINEISQCKSDLARQLKETLSKLEEKSEEEKHKTVQVELLKKDKSKLLSQVAALQSVVDGLKDERKLWGVELSQQGSSLAKDRGRLEMKIEALNAETRSLRKSNEKDLDLLRIKTKIVEDQTETIHKMKDALAKKDVEIRNKLEEHLSDQKKLQQHLEDLQRENDILQEENVNVNQRKEDYKSRLNDVMSENADLLQRHENLQSKWSHNSELLTKLEGQVQMVSESGKEREYKLLREKEDALNALNVMNNRMNKIDDEIKEQLNIANSAHLMEMKSFERDKKQEIKQLQLKVASVEDEMRQVLLETKDEKRKMEEKLRRMKTIFQELPFSDS